MIEVDVIMITYLHEKYIEEALNSVKNQVFNGKINVIVGLDCSPDNTKSVISGFREENPELQITLIDNDSNIGAQKNWINCFKHSKAKYIAMLEGDDYWIDPLKIQKQIDLLEKKEDSIACYHPCYFQREEEITKQSSSKLDYIPNIENLLTIWNIPTASIVFKREGIKDFPEWFTEIKSGDIGLFCMLYEKGTFEFIDEAMSVYRLHEGGASNHHYSNMIKYRVQFYHYLYDYFNGKYDREINNALFKIMLENGYENKLLEELVNNDSKRLYSKLSKDNLAKNIELKRLVAAITMKLKHKLT